MTSSVTVIGLTVSDGAAIAVAATSGLVALMTLVLALKTKDVAEQAKESAEATRAAAEATRTEAEATREAAEATKAEAAAVAEQVRLGEEQLRLARVAQQAAGQPWLTRVSPPPPPSPGVYPVSISVYEEPHVVYVRVGKDSSPNDVNVVLYLRNVGRGVALIGASDQCLVEGPGLNDKSETRFGFASAAALPPGEHTRLEFIVQNVDVRRFLARDRTYGELWVRVRYTDVNNEQPAWANVHLTPTGPKAQEWLVHKIEYTHNLGDPVPFAAVQFDAAVFSGP